METINIFENIDNNINDELVFEIDKDTNIALFNTKLRKLNINIYDNVNVLINDFNKNYDDLKIIFNIYNNASLNYNLSNIVNNELNVEILINYKGLNSKVETNIHSLVMGYEKIKIVGDINSECKNNELQENVKVMLINDGKCEVIPDMLIDTKLVNANHKVAISNVRDKELFYLMCKGLSKESSINLIKKSFLISNINNDELKIKIDN